MTPFPKRVVFFGFPSSNSRFSIDLKTKQIKAKPISFTSIEIEDLAERTVNFYDIDFSIHILARFERRNVKDQNGIIKKSPDPHGMSGGAVFFVYVEAGQSQDILKAINFGSSD